MQLLYEQRNMHKPYSLIPLQRFWQLYLLSPHLHLLEEHNRLYSLWLLCHSEDMTEKVWAGSQFAGLSAGSMIGIWNSTHSLCALKADKSLNFKSSPNINYDILVRAILVFPLWSSPLIHAVRTHRSGCCKGCESSSLGQHFYPWNVLEGMLS